MSFGSKRTNACPQWPPIGVCINVHDRKSLLLLSRLLSHTFCVHLLVTHERGEDRVIVSVLCVLSLKESKQGKRAQYV